jgi:hypothetical protein
MSRKSKTNPLVDKSQLDSPLENETAFDSKDKLDTDVTTLPKVDKKAVDPFDGFVLVIEDGKALKLSPKTQNHVFYQLAKKEEDNSLYIRMSGNEGGGLHSKEWVSLNSILTLLDEMKDKPLKSTLLKPVFKGGSANNCGFMAAVLRCNEIGLLTQSEKSVFVHQLHTDYDNNKAKLLAMAN